MTSVAKPSGALDRFLTPDTLFSKHPDPFKNSGLFCKDCKSLMYSRVEDGISLSACRKCHGIGPPLAHLQASNFTGHKKSNEPSQYTDLDFIRYEVCYPLVPKWKCSKCKSLGGIEISESDGTQYMLCMQDGCKFTEDTAGVTASSEQQHDTGSAKRGADKDRLENIDEEKNID
jgi:DNA-directed RNA polymerase subunit M/transcription elongation factor TFIIS